MVTYPSSFKCWSGPSAADWQAARISPPQTLEYVNVGAFFQAMAFSCTRVKDSPSLQPILTGQAGIARSRGISTRTPITSRFLLTVETCLFSFSIPSIRRSISLSFAIPPASGGWISCLGIVVPDRTLGLRLGGLRPSKSVTTIMKTPRASTTRNLEMSILLCDKRRKADRYTCLLQLSVTSPPDTIYRQCVQVHHAGVPRPANGVQGKATKFRPTPHFGDKHSKVPGRSRCPPFCLLHLVLILQSAQGKCCPSPHYSWPWGDPADRNLPCPGDYG